MKIKEGYFYFIKDEFFDVVNDMELMKNKESGSKRPCYYCFKITELPEFIWFVPVSTKVEKYKRIYLNKLKKQAKLGKNLAVDTMIFGNVANVESVFLVQNMFPVTEKYIESQYVKNNIKIRLSRKLKKEIVFKANKVLILYRNGMKKIIFPDVEKIIKILHGNSM